MTTPSGKFTELYELAGAVCEDHLSADQAARLEYLVLTDADLRRRYILYMHVHASAERYNPEADTGEDQCWLPHAEHAEARCSPDELLLEGLQAESPLASAIVLDLSPVTKPLPGLFAPGGFLFSYAVAAAVVAVGLLVAWVCQMPQYRDLATKTPSPTRSTTAEAPPAMHFVGRISALSDCHWADPTTEAIEGTYVAIGRKFSLVSGLLEIKYDSGAKVILQGPCNYEIDSRDSGFLAVGKLTAKVEKNAITTSLPMEGVVTPGTPDSKFRDRMLFAVRTPSAVVSDIGTEFAVEVDQSGTTQTHVFRGKIELQASDGGKRVGRVIALGENESARVDGTQRDIILTSSSASRGIFARQMPKWAPIKLFNTGISLREGDHDQHWQVVAISSDPTFIPRPAIVSTITQGKWLPNDPGESQWISVVGDLKYVLNFKTYTFRTVFSLPPSTTSRAILRGRFMADNHIAAIRLNGQSVEVPQHQYSAFFHWHQFKATTSFVAGENVLEFDVFNGPDPSSDTKLGKNTASPLLLRVELEGIAREDSVKSPEGTGKTGVNTD